ncbi:MAG: AIR synthase family protein [Caldilineaceae bacterium]|nr:AIR synthase family protein [Caldilineaceae bacterium]
MTQTAARQPLPAGKLPPALLAGLLTTLPTAHPQLLLGPALGEDAAVIDWGNAPDQLLVAKSDPITFATDEIGYYAVNVCANDLAVTGARPLFYLPTILLPAEQTDATTVERIFRQIGAACQQLGIVVAGGHSEITPTVMQPVVAGTLLGVVPRAQMVAGRGAQVGDAILMVGTAPIEGASIIARERRQALLDAGWNVAELDEAAHYLYSPGISVLQPALLAAEAGLVTAMHDPTEGGIATGLLELAVAADAGLVVDLDAIPLDALAVRLCHAFGLDPLGVIASGALLATAPAAQVEPLRSRWQAHGWPVAQVGHIVEKSAGRTAYRQGQTVPFPTFATDEITRLWA